MKFLLSALVLLLVCVFVAVHADCETDDGTWDPACPKDAPFCRNVGGLSIRKVCVPCRTSCDCPLNKFCSTDYNGDGNVGQCLEFGQAGKDCGILDNGQLMDDAVDGKLKCALARTTALGTRDLNFRGACVEKTCRFCQPSPSEYCDGGEYWGPARTCVWPGVEQTVHSAYWQPGAYFEEPIRVWCAIFFVLVLCICLSTVFGCGHKAKKSYFK